MIKIFLKFFFIYLIVTTNTFANETFDQWLKKFETRAIQTGISEKVVKEIIEVKPKRETKFPTNSQGKRFLTERKTFIINQAKWEAAHDYCTDRGYVFRVLTEDEIRPDNYRTKRK